MAIISAKMIKDTKTEKRTFKEDTSLGKLQDRISELELRISELEAVK